MIDVQSCFVTSLVELTAGSSIWVPEGASALPDSTGQFFEGAELYAERYTAHEHFLDYIRQTLHGVDLGGGVRRILDMGSGAGNTVFPSFSLFPEASVVATDISPRLLEILARKAGERAEWAERLACVCLDACADHYREGVFDLAIGGAILHHLLDPSAVLEIVRRALRPGGVAVFFEPFENGHAVLRLAYEEILEKAAARPLNPPARTLLTALVRDLAARTGSDKTDPCFPHLEDKWLFTREYLAKAARLAGFSSIEIKPRHLPGRIFSLQTEINLHLGAGLAPGAMEDWAWDVLRRYDELFSVEMRQELFFEAGVVFVR